MTKAEKKQAVLNKQFDMAMDGSIEMLKWLGINLCGQSNQPDVTDQPLPTGFDIRLYDDIKDEYVDMGKDE